MSEQRKGKKRPKSYYRKCAAGGKKARRTQCVSAGMKGFLVTCNKYEKETVREMYNLLNEYAEVMYGPELYSTKPRMSEESDSDSDEEDMEKAMAKETSAIKQVNADGRRFQNTDTKCKNVIFIRTTVEDPCKLAHEIFRDIQEKQVQKARYAIRMLPVSAVCAPVPKDLEKTLRDVLAPHFETEFGVGLRYTAVCKIRNNNSVSKNTILPLIGKIIKEMNPKHQLCHDEPELVIIVEVIQKACCLSVVKDYFEFRKYNLHEIIRKPTGEETNEMDKEIIDDKISGENVNSEMNVKNEEEIKANQNTVDEEDVDESGKMNEANSTDDSEKLKDRNSETVGENISSKEIEDGKDKTIESKNSDTEKSTEKENCEETLSGEAVDTVSETDGTESRK